MRAARTKRMDAIIKKLGRKPKDISEYKKIWRYLFGGIYEENQKRLRRQRQRHLQHGFGIPNINRKFCIFCIK